MTMHHDTLEMIADEFASLPRNMQHLLDRYRCNFEVAASDREREKALKEWRDELANMKDFIDVVLNDYAISENEVEDESEEDAWRADAEKRARAQHGLTVYELQEAFEDDNMGYAPEHWAVIVFAESSAGMNGRSEKERSYRVSSKCLGFDPYKGGDSLTGVCLSGSKEPIRLDLFMRVFRPGESWHSEAKEYWEVDYCYLLDKDGNRIRTDNEE